MICAVFSQQNFPNHNTRKTIAGILYVYVMVLVCWGNGKPWTTTAACLLNYYLLSSRLSPAQRTQDDTPYQVDFTWSRVLVLLLVYCLLLLKQCPKLRNINLQLTTLSCIGSPQKKPAPTHSGGSTLQSMYVQLLLPPFLLSVLLSLWRATTAPATSNQTSQKQQGRQLPHDQLT